MPLLGRSVIPRLLALFVVTGFLIPVRAHQIGDMAHDRADARFAKEFAPVRVALWRAQSERGNSGGGSGAGVAASAGVFSVAQMFEAFAPAVRLRSDEQFLFVESNGLPAHGMMVGITAWQQQVPLPQPYVGRNAWRIPRHPVPSRNPVSIKDRFLRGAIALAANGIPIFNPQNNRGELSQEIGELDQWGGHCGRADDYHYHAAPLHLQETVGAGRAIAVALDGYPLYGVTEPDGSTPRNLDAFNGHETPGLGYHYHASTKYPYVNGGFHGEVMELEGQVDPQPRAQALRPASTPLRGARITAFSAEDNRYRLDYVVGGEQRTIRYLLNPDQSARFEYVDGRGQSSTETYSPRSASSGDRKGKGGSGADKKKKAER
jgi:hypothetical protein